MSIVLDLESINADPAVSTAVRRVAEARRVDVGVQAGWLRLHPAHDGATAAFVRPRSIDIATDPLVAGGASGRLPGSRVVRTSPATSMVRVDAAVILTHPDEVHEQLVKALDWRGKGPRWNVNSVAGSVAVAAAARATCPECHQQFSASGACYCD